MPSKIIFYDPSGKRRRVFAGVGAGVGLILAVAGTLFVLSLLAVPFLPRYPGLIEPHLRVRRPGFPFFPSREVRLNRFLLRRSRLELYREIAQSSRKRRRRAARAATSPPPATSSGVVAAFYAPWQETGLDSLRTNADKLTHLIPEWLHLNRNGDGLTFQDWNFGLNPYNRDAIEVARENHLKICPLISNVEGGDFDGQRVHRLLASAARQQAVITHLVSWLKTQNFQGLNVDFENLSDADSARMGPFLVNLSQALGRSHLTMSVDVEAENTALPLERIAAVSDFVLLMVYDENGQTGAPGPIASAGWSYRVTQAALKRIPPSKLVMGIGNYSYDWTQGDKAPANSLTYDSALMLARDNRPGEKPQDVIDFDNDALNSTFNYQSDDGKSHEVWMLDAVSAYNQWRLARRARLRGGALWLLGSEDPDVWNFFNQDDQNKTVPATVLQHVTFPYEVEFDGNGEILTVETRPQEGYRQVTYDPRVGLCTDMEYEKFPSSYVIRRTGYHPREIALTFDDGPSPYTPQVLDVLKQNGVQGTFFMIGENVEHFPGLARLVYKDGNEIGNHTFTHPNIAEVSPRRARLEINTTQRAIESIVGRSTVLFRPPYNADAEPETAEEVRPIELASRLGYVTVGELIDPQDWNLIKALPDGSTTTRTSADILAQIRQGLATEQGDVLLMHDGGGDRSRTVAALRVIIPELRAKGYRFVMVSQLLGLPRDVVMPAISPKDLLVIGFDRVMFNSIFTVENFLSLAFLTAILVGIARVLLVTPLAVAATRKERHQVYDPTFQPTVSVVIAAYNEEPVIERTLRSILASDYPQLEIVVVDDGSRDGTAEVVRAKFSDEPRVRLARQENGGKASALNHAMEVAGGEILVGFDADTQIAANTVSLLVRHFEAPDIAAVAGNVKVGNRTNLMTRWQAIEYITSQNVDRRAYALLNAITVVPGAVGAWRRSAVLEAGGYVSDTLAEDMDLTWRLRQAGWRLTTDSAALAFTEAPDTLRAFVKQRLRWAYGTLQNLYKHRKMLFHHGWFGWLGLPTLWLFQIFLQLLAPFVDLQMAYVIGNFASTWLAQGLLHADWQPLPLARAHLAEVGFYYSVFFATELVCAVVAFRLDRERLSLLWWLFWQRFVYRQLMYAVVWKSVWMAVGGLRQGWGKLQRKGTVQVPNRTL